MDCPECKSAQLTPTKLEPSLAARSCGACSGAMLDLVAYRLWAERHSHEADAAAELSEEPATDQGALLCPGCRKIMLRFRYTAGTAHVLDVCSTCDVAWIQRNEWAFLKRLSLHGALTHIFTDPWQRSLRQERTRRALDSEWDKRLGTDLHAEAGELRQWLQAHPKKQELLDYLRRDDPYGI